MSLSPLPDDDLLPLHPVLQSGAALPRISQRPVGALPDGRVVDEYTLHHGGLTLSVLTLGGIVSQLQVPDRHGQPGNVVFGLARLSDHLNVNRNFSSLVGRYGNRIAGAQFSLDGQAYPLPANNGPNCLHGGPQGFGVALWQAQAIAHTAEGDVALVLRHTSPHGDQGFPGTLTVTVTYTLTAQAGWQIDYEARTDAPTVVNLTHHAYVNLAGQGSALGHVLQIAGSRYCAVDAVQIPRAIEAVAGTPLDFRQPTVINARIRQHHPQLALGRGLDHHWLLDKAEPPTADGLHLAAQLSEPGSGRVMTLHTSEPGVQFYSGNFLDGSLLGRHRQWLRQGDAVCLETQHSPDSPHHGADDPDWPSTVLRPGGVYRSRSRYSFSTRA